MSTTTNWFTCGTGASADRDSKVEWLTPTNAQAEDAAYASCAVAKNTYSDWLRATNFGFSGTGGVPTGAAILGIEMRIKCYETGGTGSHIRDSAVYLRRTSGQVGDNRASSTVWPTSNDWRQLNGADDDNWNAGLSDSDVRSSDFGVDISASNPSFMAAVDAYVDCVQLRITYTTESTRRGQPAIYNELMVF